MRIAIKIAVLLIALQQTFAYSKYGRSCKDIGCLNNEECVMAEDPCSYMSRDQCGMYPTCKPAGSTSAPSCQNYQCPPTQICHLDDGTPKCVPSKSTSTRVEHTQNQNTQSAGSNAASYPAQNPSYPAQNPSYPAQNPSYPAQNPSYPAQNPSYPNYPSNSNSQSGSLYPSIPTSRPANAGGYPGSSGSGYPGYPSQGGGYPSQGGGYPSQGGGYPSQGGGYPSQGGGYPSQGGGYPSQGGGYPSQGYPSQGYPSQSGGYPSQGYPSQRYPSQGQTQGYATYNRQPTYSSQPTGNRYGNTPPKSDANPIVDRITDSLKTLGLFCVLIKYLSTRFLNV